VNQWGKVFLIKKPETMKNKDLYRFHLELEDLKNSVYYHLMRGRISDFYKNNGLRVNSMLANINALQTDYFVFENGIVKTEIKIGEENHTPVMNEGKGYSEYVSKFDALMDSDCTIIF